MIIPMMETVNPILVNFHRLLNHEVLSLSVIGRPSWSVIRSYHIKVIADESRTPARKSVVHPRPRWCNCLPCNLEQSSLTQMRPMSFCSIWWNRGEWGWVRASWRLSSTNRYLRNRWRNYWTTGMFPAKTWIMLSAIIHCEFADVVTVFPMAMTKTFLCAFSWSSSTLRSFYSFISTLLLIQSIWEIERIVTKWDLEPQVDSFLIFLYICISQTLDYC